jgi:hypothetical protein
VNNFDEIRQRIRHYLAEAKKFRHSSTCQPRNRKAYGSWAGNALMAYEEAQALPPSECRELYGEIVTHVISAGMRALGYCASDFEETKRPTLFAAIFGSRAQDICDRASRILTDFGMMIRDPANATAERQSAFGNSLLNGESKLAALRTPLEFYGYGDLYRSEVSAMMPLMDEAYRRHIVQGGAAFDRAFNGSTT